VEQDFQTLSGRESGVFDVTGRDRSDTKWIVRYFGDILADRYYLYDRKEGKLTLLLDAQPALAQYTLAPVKPLVIPARDGLSLPSYLTLPVGVEPKGLPLILYPHGGPWADDQWIFDAWVQLLANRGYAVLQVNFRGSTGYGKAHLNAGNGQWGVGSMQHDLTDAVKWAVDQGIADPKRVAISGGSYGGYATLSGITFTPELYACAVALVAPSNVKTLFESFPPYWAIRKKRWMLRVGDVEHDEALNRKISPLFHVDQIRAPLLIGHGSNDPRVKQSESDAIVAAMREHNRPVTYVVYPDEGHGLGRPENSLDFVGRMEEFLAQHLGGRKEPFRDVPGSSVEVR
jgi:dipeptidyl aminopeptidase/acylaminoacyl peptidase